MTVETFNHLCIMLLIMLVLQSGIQVLAFAYCGERNFSEKFVEQERRFINLTYLLNCTETTSLENASIVFDVCRNNGKATQCTFRWRAQINDMAVKNWGSGNQTSCSHERLDLSQSMLTWKLTISQLLDRSLSVMHLYVDNFTHSEKTVQTIRLIHVDVLYPPRITSLTVDGHEADSSHLIDKGQKVTISCFYDKGNPPKTFYLLDKHGSELAEGESEGNLTYSLSAQCEDDWPTIRCEGNGSELNRSVPFLVRCPPQFVDSSVTIITSPELETKTFRVKAHNTSITECYLTSSSSENKSREEANCILIGTPPNLVLTLHFNEVRITQGNWTVILRNELGSTNTTMYIMDTTGVQHAATIDGLVIGLPCGAVLLAAVIAFVVIRAKTLVKQQNQGRTDRREVSIEEDVSNREACVKETRRAQTTLTYAAFRFEDRQDGACPPSRVHRKKGKLAKECRTRVAEETEEAIHPASLGMPSTSGRRNADGLIYGDLDFTDMKVSDVIIGSESGIEYTRINITAIAPPPRDYKQKYNHKR